MPGKKKGRKTTITSEQLTAMLDDIEAGAKVKDACDKQGCTPGGLHYQLKQHPALHERYKQIVAAITGPRQGNIKVSEAEYNAALDRVTQGETVTQIAKDLGIRRETFYLWLQKDPERVRRYEESAPARARALSSRAMELVEEIDADSMDYYAANIRIQQANALQRVAAVLYPERYDTSYRAKMSGVSSSAINIQVNVGNDSQPQISQPLKAITVEPEDKE